MVHRRPASGRSRRRRRRPGRCPRRGPRGLARARRQRVRPPAGRVPDDPGRLGRRAGGGSSPATRGVERGPGGDRVTAVQLGPRDLVPWLLDASGVDGEWLCRVAIDEVSEGAGGTVTMRGSRGGFAVEATWTPLPSKVHGWHLEIEVRLDADDALDASVAIAVQPPADPDPDADPAWMVPGVFYGANRPADSSARHPRWVPDRIESNGDPFASHEWWLRADRCAIPAVLATSGGVRVGLATRELSALGQAGVGFGTVDTPDGPRREIRLSFPYRELPVVYDGSPEVLPPDRPTHRWQPGEAVRLEARVYAVPAGRNASGPILRDLHAWLAAGPPLEPRVSVEEAATLAADG